MKKGLSLLAKVWIISVFLAAAQWHGVLVDQAAALEQAQAQTQANGSISISPLITELEVDAGNSYKREIRVRNTNRIPFEVSFEAHDVEIEQVSHNVKFLPEESKQNTQRSLASWISPLGQEVFELEPGDDYVFEYELGIADGIAAGDYFASLNFSYRPVGGDFRAGNIKVRQSIGSLLLLKVAGEGAPEGSLLEDFQVSVLKMVPKGEVTELSVDVTNNTLRYMSLKPMVTISDDQGEVYYQRLGRPKRVFPGEEMVLTNSFPNSYLASEVPLQMEYSVWDRTGKNQIYQEEVQLETVSAWDRWGDRLIWILKWGFAVGTVLIAGALVWMKRKGMTTRSGRRKK